MESTSRLFFSSLLTLAARFAPYIRMDAYKRSRLKNILKASGLNLEPEVYQAYALVKAGAMMLAPSSTWLSPVSPPVL